MELMRVAMGTGFGKWVIGIEDEFPSTPIQPWLVARSSYARTRRRWVHCGRRDSLQRSQHNSRRYCQVCSSWRGLIQARITTTQWPNYLNEIFWILIPHDGLTQVIEHGILLAIFNNEMLPPRFDSEGGNGTCRQKVMYRWRAFLEKDIGKKKE